MDLPWTNTGQEVLQHFGVDAHRGLSSTQAEKHAELYGKNGTCHAYPLWRDCLICYFTL